jgi:hypothetical protein
VCCARADARALSLVRAASTSGKRSSAARASSTTTWSRWRTSVRGCAAAQLHSAHAHTRTHTPAAGLVVTPPPRGAQCSTCASASTCPPWRPRSRRTRRPTRRASRQTE